MQNDERLGAVKSYRFPDLTGLSPKIRSTLIGFSYKTRCSPYLLSRLKAETSSEDRSLETIFQAAWGKVLASLSNEGEAAFIYNHCQDGSMPMHFSLQPESTNGDLIKQAEEQFAEGRLSVSCSNDSDISVQAQLSYQIEPLENTRRQNPEVPSAHLIVLNDDNAFCLTLRAHRSLINESDLDLVLDLVENALQCLTEQPSSMNASWRDWRTKPGHITADDTFIDTDLPLGETVHSLVEHHAKLQPEKIAIDFMYDDKSRTSWSFSQLNQAANNIVTTVLRVASVSLEESIPICISKSPLFYASILAVMKIGACFVPFSNLPSDRKKFMLEELDAKLVICDSREDLSWCKVKSVCISNVSADAKIAPNVVDQSAWRHAKGNNLVYHMYTSGSTGRPKAVSIEHRNAVETAMVSRNLIPWRQESRILQYAAPSFDMCYYDTFLAWALGITLCCTTDNLVYNNLTTVINDLEVDMLGLTPSVAVTLDPSEFPTVRWMYCIGEVLPQELVEKWDGRLSNSYGPTEATQMVTLFPVNPKVKAAVIGTPFQNTFFKILTPLSNSELPPLTVGELCIGGLQLARGYYGNDDKTKASFIEWQNTRLYRTGDLARKLGNDTFEFIGRVDDQVKIRGQRVELGEINSVIHHMHREVHRATSHIMKVGDHGADQLVTFITPQASLSPNKWSWLEYKVLSQLQTILPAYMVPNILITIPKLPLSAARKIDRKALQSLLQKEVEQRSRSGHGGDTFSTVGMLIRQAYASASNIPVSNIGPDVTIFELGIDSILALKVASRLQKQDLMLDAGDVLSAPSVRSLETLLEGRTGRVHSNEIFDFGKFDREHRKYIAPLIGYDQPCIEKILPCSPLQSGMVAQTLQVNAPIYFNTITYAIPEDYHFSTIQMAWDALVMKYEILRSGFINTDSLEFPFSMVIQVYNRAFVQKHVIFDEKPDLNALMRDLHSVFLHDSLSPPWKIVCQRNEMHLIAHHSLYDAQVIDLWIHDLTLACRNVALAPVLDYGIQMTKLLCHDSIIQRDSDEFWTGSKNEFAVTKFPVLTPLRIEDSKMAEVSCFSTYTLSDIDELCRTRGVTLQAAGQAAWGSVLSSIVGENKVTFGTVLSGRTTEESQQVGLPCITTIPTPFDSSYTYQDRLHKILEFNARVQKYQFTPLKRIESLVGSPNSSLFDSIFTVQKRNSTHEDPNGFKFVRNNLTIDYPISIEFEPRADGRLQLNIYYRVDRLPQEQAKLIIRQIDAQLHQILGDDQTQKKNSVGLADKTLYSVMPAKKSELACSTSLLHQLFEEKYQEHPDKTAVEHVLSIPVEKEPISTREWTYGAVDAESNRLAQLLVSSGIKVGSIVAICFEKCPEAAFCMLGILKAGCSFLAVDPGAPDERKIFILQDSKAAALLTKGDVLGSLKADNRIPVYDIKEIPLTQYESAKPILDRAISPQDLSYCLYTSGTTGIPKGCAITHENAVQAMMSFQHLYKWEPESRWLQFASYHFDVSVMEHFWSWSVGIRVVIAARDIIFNDLSESIKRLAISHLDLTPSLAQTLDPTELPLLANGVFVVGGEPLKQEILDKWGSTGAIHNAYGPTEATIGVTMYTGVPKNGRSANIGHQFPNVGALVVKPSDTETVVLRGAVGELCVSGKLVAKGYIGRPELTSERFIHLDGTRFYRTGDLVRLLYDGTYEFIGRVDDQVKLRGQRLEIGEINSVIKKSHEEVFDTATQVLRHPKQTSAQLVTFIMFKGTIELDKEDPKILKDDSYVNFLNRAENVCKQKLPLYMVPTHFLAVNKLPLSSNNKADAKCLKALYESLDVRDLHSISKARVVQRNQSTGSPEQRAKILKVLEKVLGRPVEGGSTGISFLELGLDSISIISFSRKLREFDIAASTSFILSNATVDQLNAAISDKQLISENHVEVAKQRIKGFHHHHLSSILETLKITPSEVECIAPCTPIQQGMISKALKQADGVYFNLFEFQDIPPEDVKRLKIAFGQLIGHLQILRTIFVPTNEGYAQVVLRSNEFPWSEATQEKRFKPASEDFCWQNHQNWIADCLDSQVITPLSFSICEESGLCKVAWSLFHACYDGRSLDSMIKCLAAEFRGGETIIYGPDYHEILPFGPLKSLPKAREFWETFLGQMTSPVAFPVKVAQPAASDCHIIQHVVNLDGIEHCRRVMSTTHQAIFQTCWNAALCEAADGPTSLGLILSGSITDFEGAENVIGPTFNALPFQMKFENEDDWVSAVARCQGINSKILTYQHTPLRSIQKWAREGPKKGSHLELFSSIFVFERQPLDDKGTHPPWKNIKEDIRPDYPLAFEVLQTSETSIRVLLISQKDYTDRAQLNALVNRFLTFLRSLLANPNNRISGVVKISSQNMPRNDSEAAAAITQGDHRGITPNNYLDFVWDYISGRIRYEIAKIAELDAGFISPDTSILELGLDSVDAVKLSARLRQALNIHLPVSKLMAALTVRKMSIIASKTETGISPISQTKAREKAYEQLKRYARKKDIANTAHILYCTPVQEAMIAAMITSRYHKYITHDILRLKDNVDVEKLRSAWLNVVEHTPVLRSRILQVTDPNIPVSFALVISNHVSGDLWKTDSMQEEADWPHVFEKARAEIESSSAESPPFRLTLVRNDSDDRNNFLVLSVSHALYDGWSINLVHNAVALAYRDNDKREPEIPLLISQVNHLRDQMPQNSRTFWENTLYNVQSSILSPGTTQKLDDGSPFRLEKRCKVSATEVQQFCRKIGVTVSALTQTVWSFVLSTVLGQLDVSFGLILSGRDTIEAQNLIFPTMNTVVARMVIHGTLKEMIQYCQQTLTAMSAHQQFPLREALKLAQPTKPMNVFNTLFINQQKPQNTQVEFPALYESIGGSADIEYPLCVEAEVQNGSLTWRLAGKQNYLSKAMCQDLLEQLDNLSTYVLRHADEVAAKFVDDHVKIGCLEPFKPRQAPFEADTNEQDALSSALTHEHEWTHREMLIRKAISQVAKLPEDSIDIDASLSELGLDSISAIKVLTLLRSERLNTTMQDLISSNSIRRIASSANITHTAVRVLNSEISTARCRIQGIPSCDLTESLSLLGIDPSRVETILPATSGQVFMLTKWQISGLYLSFLTFKVHRITSRNVITQAWRDLVAQAPILRAVFVTSKNGKWPIYQVILEDIGTEIDYLDTVDNAKTKESENAGYRPGIRDVTIRPVRPTARRLDNATWEIQLQLHHALYDGYSLHLLLSRFTTALSQTGCAYTSSIADYLQYHELADRGKTDSRAFWTAYLEKVAPRTLQRSDEGINQRVHVVVPRLLDDITALRSCAKLHQVSLQSVLIATWSRLYAKLAGALGKDDELCIGLYVAARNFDNAEMLELPTLNFVPLRILAPLHVSIEQCAQKIQHDLQMISEQSRSTVGLWQLQQWIGTDFHIDSWVNLIIGEGVGGSELQSNSSGPEIKYEESREEKCEITEYEPHLGNEKNFGLYLEQNAVREAYVTSLDFEITLYKDSIDAGIVSPSSLASAEKAKELLGNMSDQLQKWSQEDGRG